MAALNKVMLMGNLTRDPQIKQLPSNTTLAEFGLATTRRYKTATGEEREETCFIDCTVFGRQAEAFLGHGVPAIAQWRAFGSLVASIKAGTAASPISASAPIARTATSGCASFKTCVKTGISMVGSGPKRRSA